MSHFTPQNGPKIGRASHRMTKKYAFAKQNRAGVPPSSVRYNLLLLHEQAQSRLQIYGDSKQLLVYYYIQNVISNGKIGPYTGRIYCQACVSNGGLYITIWKMSFFPCFVPFTLVASCNAIESAIYACILLYAKCHFSCYGGHLLWWFCIA